MAPPDGREESNLEGKRKDGTTRRNAAPDGNQLLPSYDPTERGDPMKLLSVVPPTVEFDGRYFLIQIRIIVF